jgi:hypothetical protein
VASSKKHQGIFAPPGTTQVKPPTPTLPQKTNHTTGMKIASRIALSPKANKITHRHMLKSF